MCAFELLYVVALYISDCIVCGMSVYFGGHVSLCLYPICFHPTLGGIEIRVAGNRTYVPLLSALTDCDGSYCPCDTSLKL